jgi:hypothetical protein
MHIHGIHEHDIKLENWQLVDTLDKQSIKKLVKMGVSMIFVVPHERNLSQTRPSSIPPPHSLLNRLSHRNTFLLSKAPTNNLHSHRHTINQIDII